MPGQYILNEKGEPEPCDDLIKWAKWLETATDRTVAKDKAGDAEVSTVFLGLDHSFGQGPPLLYETLVFGGPMEGEQERYSTKEQAEAGHKRILAAVREWRA